MAYRNKTYVCFDADNDMWAYAYMKGWKENERIAFDFHNAHEINNLRDGSSEETIKKKLLERLKNTKVFVVLIGEQTANLYKYVRWEIEYAIDNDVPIIVVNLNKNKKMDSDFCPPILKKKLAIHIPYGQKTVNYALNNWPRQHIAHILNNETGPYGYSENVYKEL